VELWGTLKINVKFVFQWNTMMDEESGLEILELTRGGVVEDRLHGG
jgi:hypothetical protein